MKRVLLLEDDDGLGATLTERLTDEGYDVVWSKTLHGARSKMSGHFDLAILDVGLPDGSGFDWAREMRSSSLTPFIFVTARSTAEDRLHGYELGADEYIPKPFHLRELLLRVRHVLENHVTIKAFRVGDVMVDVTALTLTKGPVEERLTVKEAAFLQLLIARSPQAVSRDDVLNIVWGPSEAPSHRSVDNMVVRLRQMFGSNDTDGVIESVRGVGYRWIYSEDKT
jgi:two-component system, OmpR family, phosphate regulon response regulator PhoB